jgi:hypothetical protein
MLEPQGGVGISSRGVAVLRGAFISILAYTYWLELSSRQIVIADFGPWHEILNSLGLVSPGFSVEIGI